ncbi:carbon-nitrogen hydrolase family protein [Alkalihalobacterium bogoriense]|uniref:carbon-nitrogen hydrolase family protein n=1 Tax=Alkalihalobacterium bogoriense TaxID=246272 RepID=UPI00047A6668|nr:carbon-nitrogen hydrolase family protein [Alkalihalobacterium bogoriense]
MRIGLAQVPFSLTPQNGLQNVISMVEEASNRGCDIVCFPESTIPGLRGVGFDVAPYDHQFQKDALMKVQKLAKIKNTAIILPIEWQKENKLHIIAVVISKNGEILGYQTKNQIDPDEDQFGYEPGSGRQIFEIEGVRFGIVICHEGWRYPETVRFAAVNGASIIFHPQFTNDVENSSFYENAMICRSLENNVYFASVNYALPNQQVSTTLISPTGQCLAKAQREQNELIVFNIDPVKATRVLATRFNKHLIKKETSTDL